MLICDELNAYYGNFHVLQNVSLTLEQGSIHTLLGRNGAGKTTTLRAIFGLVPGATGRIEVDGSPINHRQPYEITRAGLAFVPEYRGVFGDLTVMENIKIAERRGGEWPAERVFDLFPPLRKLAARKGGHLSGGEQQMLAIGRALMSSPKILLLDEPSQGLAPRIVDMVVDTMLLLRKQNLGILLVEQNAEIALEIADKASIIEQGRIVFHGTPEETRADQAVMNAYLGVG
jgi:branched-chain amino acid transport system ATP-binding protein